MDNKPTKQDFLLSILALDAYNRGAPGDVSKVGLELDATDTVIGEAEFKIVSNNTLPETAFSGFSASEYSLDGKSVISFRGTDFDFTTLSSASEFLRDVVAGWFPSFNILGNDFSLLDGPLDVEDLTIGLQPANAAEFYELVTGSSVFDESSQNVIVTGHSLGGSLAGFVGSLSGAEAVILMKYLFLDQH